MASQKKVAIIHRYQHLIDLYSHILRDRGYIPSTMLVDKKTTPLEVATFVGEHNPDLVFLVENYQAYTFSLDPSKRGDKIGEGLEALVKIREINSRIPIFMVSGSPLYEDKAMALGANGYLKIPAGPEEFLQLVEKNLQS